MLIFRALFYTNTRTFNYNFIPPIDSLGLPVGIMQEEVTNKKANTRISLTSFGWYGIGSITRTRRRKRSKVKKK